MRRRPPLVVGTKYNDWTVVKQLNLDTAICRCKCGTEHEVSIAHMLGGRSQRCRTCGNERPSYKWRPLDSSKVKTKYPSRLKRVVTDAIARCTDETHECWKYYGERGIKVVQEWLDDSRLFVEYLMTLSGWDNPELIIDRVDNDKGYVPGNLRWATYTESANNKRQVEPTIMTSDRVAEAIELRKQSKEWTYCKLGERYGATPSAVYLAIKRSKQLTSK